MTWRVHDPAGACEGTGWECGSFRTLFSLAWKVAGPADVSTTIDHASLDLEPAISTLSHALQVGAVDICADASPTSRQSDVVDSLDELQHSTLRGPPISDHTQYMQLQHLLAPLL